MLRPLKVFICHSFEDKRAAHELFKQLTSQGVDAWLDEERLLAGQDWQLEIPGALQSADVVIICISALSVTKSGYIQKEIKLAIEKAEEKPEGTIFIIPVRLEQCDIPRNLKKWQWVDLFEDTGYKKLLSSLNAKAQSIGSNLLVAQTASIDINLQTWANIKFMYIPAGSFIFGSKDNNYLASDMEKHQHQIELPYSFYIGRYPVTNAQFNQFVVATKHGKALQDNNWSKRPDYPATNIDWYSARAFCQWLNRTIGKKLPKYWQFRLPTEAEWEKAARGEKGFEWPWGNEWSSNVCNSQESGEDRVTRVGYYSPDGDSPYGVADMAGNVWEWTISLWGTGQEKSDFFYPYNPKDGRENINAESNFLRVIRGGSFQDCAQQVRCTFKRGGFPRIGWPSSGFRVAICPKVFD